ncbi:hypothetical protein AQUCO_12500023v1 [Aquilegia coerulea]|uniref:Uncharacterized protein n=1 Tax=Aquilegia coerulea TaxID=218851 RepID=A0A2G5C1J3_AQUCA|nr:hypothetical protein AQUCO_12500023v1 [Aquilegia coerulea]
MLKVSVDIGTGTTERGCCPKLFADCSKSVWFLGAEHIGIPCVILRSSLTSRREFPSADAKMDGFGGVDLTVSRLRQKG